MFFFFRDFVNFFFNIRLIFNFFFYFKVASLFIITGLNKIYSNIFYLIFLFNKNIFFGGFSIGYYINVLKLSFEHAKFLLNKNLSYVLSLKNINKKILCLFLKTNELTF